MSDVARAARVHHIRQWRDLYPHFQVDDWGENGVFEMVDLLLSEVDRRDAILRRLVALDPIVGMGGYDYDDYVCGACPDDYECDVAERREDVVHHPACVWVQAKELYGDE